MSVFQTCHNLHMPCNLPSVGVHTSKTNLHSLILLSLSVFLSLWMAAKTCDYKSFMTYCQLITDTEMYFLLFDLNKQGLYNSEDQPRSHTAWGRG